MRKNPIKHKVRQHKRKNIVVHSYWRGRGTPKPLIIRRKSGLGYKKQPSPKFRSKRFPWKTWEYTWEDNKFFIIYREDSEIKSKKEMSYEEWSKQLTNARENLRFGLFEKINSGFGYKLQKPTITGVTFTKLLKEEIKANPGIRGPNYDIIRTNVGRKLNLSKQEFDEILGYLIKTGKLQNVWLFVGQKQTKIYHKNMEGFIFDSIEEMGKGIKYQKQNPHNKTIKYNLYLPTDVLVSHRKQHRKADLLWMSPKEFLQKIEKYKHFEKIDKQKLIVLEDRLRRGLPLDPLWIRYWKDKTEIHGIQGRHRALVAQKLKIEKIPVLVMEW